MHVQSSLEDVGTFNVQQIPSLVLLKRTRVRLSCTVTSLSNMGENHTFRHLNQIILEFSDKVRTILHPFGDLENATCLADAIEKTTNGASDEILRETFGYESASGRLTRFLSLLCDTAEDPPMCLVGTKRTFEETQSARSTSSTRSDDQRGDVTENNNEGIRNNSKCSRGVAHDTGCGQKIRKIESNAAILEEQARMGDVKAKTELALRLLHGHGAPRSIPKAIEHLTASACAGDRLAQSWLADCYEKGVGVIKNIYTARVWYERADQGGHRHATFILAERYKHGWGVSRPDLTEALRYYRKAAAMGCFTAQHRIGDLYYYGRGVPQDFIESFRWYKMAEQNGSTRAVRSLAFAFENGHGVKVDRNEASRLFKKYRMLEMKKSR